MCRSAASGPQERTLRHSFRPPSRLNGVALGSLFRPFMPLSRDHNRSHLDSFHFTSLLVSFLGYRCHSISANDVMSYKMEFLFLRFYYKLIEVYLWQQMFTDRKRQNDRLISFLMFK